MKLISMTTFVLEQDEKWEKQNIANSDMLNNIVKYANFLKQPLELWMFVPCDKNGNVLDKPNVGMYGYDHVYTNYTKAKEKCLFKGFEYKNKSLWYCDGFDRIIIYTENLCFDSCKTIEDLLKYNPQLKLTQTAIKKIGL